MEFLFKLSHMAVTNIQDEIFDILTPLEISQQILGIMLCFEVPLFSFAMLITELAHKRLNIPPHAYKLHYKLIEQNNTTYPKVV